MPHPLIRDDSFPPGRNTPCFCGSGKRFKRCCGAQSAERSPPHGIDIVEDFLSREECRELVSMAEALEGRRFQVRDRARKLEAVPDPTRVAEWMVLGESQHVLDDVVARAFEERIIPGSGQAIEWYEEPQLLRYTTGGYYQYHADAYHLVPEARAWRKAVDRDISLLLYLNDEYEGGALHFKRLSWTLRPRAGMLVWFPSDVRYEHMAKLVTKGYRYTIVSWAAASGVERVQAERAMRSIAWDSREKKLPAS